MCNRRVVLACACIHCCRYNDAVSYGELFLQNEYEMSVYNLDEANVEEVGSICMVY